MLTNLGVASLLVTFYGYQHAAETNICTTIDMHHDRDSSCRDLLSFMNEPSLHREGLRDVMSPHVIG